MCSIQLANGVNNCFTWIFMTNEMSPPVNDHSPSHPEQVMWTFLSEGSQQLRHPNGIQEDDSTNMQSNMCCLSALHKCCQLPSRLQTSVMRVFDSTAKCRRSSKRSAPPILPSQVSEWWIWQCVGMWRWSEAAIADGLGGHFLLWCFGACGLHGSSAHLSKNPRHRLKLSTHHEAQTSLA